MTTRETSYDFGLSPEQEERAKELHDQAIVIDMLFQGPLSPQRYRMRYRSRFV